MNAPLTVSVGSKATLQMFSHPRWQPIGASAPQSISGAFLIGKEFFAKGASPLAQAWAHPDSPTILFRGDIQKNPNPNPLKARHRVI
jgi:hypothetical protein